tara:strand:- start:12 stop:608 length:597 start_codon:yes stop_codon:yes gene_type:complete
MTYNKPDTKLDECIYVAEKIIPPDLCDSIVQDIETREWQPHRWYTSSSDTTHSNDRELDIQFATSELTKKLSSYLIEAGKLYNQNYAYKHPRAYERTGQMMSKFCPVRFNRYSTGQIMRQHMDHIHSIFDGVQKGIPVLSFILNFNDDYEGADLFFWDDSVIKLGKGDVCLFPSNFLFPHGVTEVTKGKRYSGVCWGW